MADSKRWVNRTECNHGHPWVFENLLVRSDGAYRCRECKQIESAKRPPRKR